MYCDEYEVEIDNKENSDRIFNDLSLEQIAVVDKTRVKYLYLVNMKSFQSLLISYFIDIEVKNTPKQFGLY